LDEGSGMERDGKKRRKENNGNEKIDKDGDFEKERRIEREKIKK
jgi:hypothetical protein